MTIYNVRASVVDLIAADSPQEALQSLERRLRTMGFDVYEGEPGDAFESDDQPDRAGRTAENRLESLAEADDSFDKAGADDD